MVRAMPWRMMLFGPGAHGLPLRWLAVRLAMVCLAGAAIVAVLREYRQPVRVISVSLVEPVVFPGQQLMRRIEVHRYRRCETTVDFILFDGKRTRFHTVRGPFASPGPLGPDAYVSPYRVASDADAGRAELRVTVTYNCSWVHRLFGGVKLHNPPLFFRIAG